LPKLPKVTADDDSENLTNPTLPVAKNLILPGVSNFGPNSPVKGRTLVVTKVTPGTQFPVQLVVKLRWKS
jgi:hypothetical protein